MLSLIANSEPSIRRTKCGHARRQVIIPSLSVPARCQVTDGVTEVPHAKNADAAAAERARSPHSPRTRTNFFNFFVYAERDMDFLGCFPRCSPQEVGF